MMKLVDGQLVPLTAEELVQYEVDQAAPPASLAHRIEWGAVIRRMSEGEAAAFDAAVEAAEPRFKWLIQKTAYISTDDPDFPALEQAFVATFGVDRAKELLAA